MTNRIFSKNYWQAIFFLSRIIIIKRNANTFLGWIWLLIQPFLHILVISLFMSFLLRQDPRLLVVNLVGTLPFWLFIVQALMDSGESLKQNSEVLKRVLLPKTYFPIAHTITHCYTLFLSFSAMYLTMVMFYPSMFTWKIIFIPLLALPLVICVMTSGIAVAFASPYIRDIPQLINVILNVLYWTVPIIYPYNLIPESKRIFFDFHPIYIVLKPMQDLVVHGVFPSLLLIIKSWVVACIVTIISFFIHRLLAKEVIFYL
jgi:lipopolysaccharide transport system permease protein